MDRKVNFFVKWHFFKSLASIGVIRWKNSEFYLFSVVKNVFEEEFFGCSIVFHGPMIVEVIVGNVDKNCSVKVDAFKAMLV